MVEKYQRFPKDAVIRLLADASGTTYGVENNPKRVGSAAHDKFTRYYDGMTVEEAYALGLKKSDFHNDTTKNYITIELPQAQTDPAG